MRHLNEMPGSQTHKQNQSNNLLKRGGLFFALLFCWLAAAQTVSAKQPSGIVYVTTEKSAGEDVNGDGELSDEVDFFPVLQAVDLATEEITTIGMGFLDAIEGENSNVTPEGKVVYIAKPDPVKSPVRVFDSVSGEIKDLRFEGRNAAISGNLVIVQRYNISSGDHELLVHDLLTGNNRVIHRSQSRIEADIDGDLVAFITRPQTDTNYRLFYYDLSRSSTTQTDYDLHGQIFAPVVDRGRIAFVTMHQGKRSVILLNAKTGEDQILPIEPFDTKIDLEGDLVAFTKAIEREADIRAFTYNLASGELVDTGITSRRVRLQEGVLMTVEGRTVRGLGPIVLQDLESGRTQRSRVLVAPHFGFGIY